MAKRKKAKEPNHKIVEVSDSFFLRFCSWGIWVCTAGVIWLVVIDKTWQSEADPISALIFDVILLACFFLFAFYAVTVLGRIEISEIGIARINYWGRFQLRWDEMTRFEIAHGDYYVFYSGERYFGCPGPLWWAKKHRGEAALLIASQIKRYGIEKIISGKNSFKLGHKTKVD